MQTHPNIKVTTGNQVQSHDILHPWYLIFTSSNFKCTTTKVFLQVRVVASRAVKTTLTTIANFRRNLRIHCPFRPDIILLISFNSSREWFSVNAADVAFRMKSPVQGISLSLSWSIYLFREDLDCLFAMIIRDSNDDQHFDQISMSWGHAFVGRCLVAGMQVNRSNQIIRNSVSEEREKRQRIRERISYPK